MGFDKGQKARFLMRNFDSFIAIDWSGAETVYTKSIAVAACRHDALCPSVISGPHKSGYWSRADVGKYIKQLAEGSKRVLVGIDCNFGYARAVSEAHFGTGHTAYEQWAHVDAANRDLPNYFARNFWRDPRYAPYFWTELHRPAVFAPPRRLTEQTCGDSGYGWPESPFKLVYSKQVGKGGLAGMRLAHDLQKSCGHRVAFWPFDDKEKQNKATVVVSEIYPRLFIRLAGMGNAKITKTAELDKVLAKLGAGPSDAPNADISDHAADAIIAAAGLRFLCGRGKEVPPRYAYPSDDARLRTEGWIFGVGAMQ
ncbi:MAG: hypothetical protein KGQ41_06575 [Alphaproteobacteria bacterium]|nr:hypothetical protein [Alphaproteobacteria bacterium]